MQLYHWLLAVVFDWFDAFQGSDAWAAHRDPFPVCSRHSQEAAASCSQITALAFSPDGQTLLSGSEDGSMAAWDLGSARRLASMHSHRSAVWSLAFSHGAGSVLASGGLVPMKTSAGISDGIICRPPS